MRLATKIFPLLAVLLSCPAHAEPPPTREQMRAYRISLMSDAQIREAKSAADAELAHIERADGEAVERERIDAMARYARCADLVYSVRNPAECKPKAPALSAGLRLRKPTIDELFDEQILGACAFARDMAQAVKFRCASAD